MIEIFKQNFAKFRFWADEPSAEFCSESDYGELFIDVYNFLISQLVLIEHLVIFLRCIKYS